MCYPWPAQQDGTILEVYRGFNASWTNVSKYFDSPSAINQSMLTYCNETRLMIQSAMETYLNVTGAGLCEGSGFPNFPLTFAVMAHSQGDVTFQGLPGDWEGIVSIDGKVTRGRCFDTYFWYSPSCRHAPEQCVAWVTAGNGWELEGAMQKASAFNMPLALAVAGSWTYYTKLPLDVASTFYWWVPDNTFLNLNPTRVAFPPFDRRASEQGDRRQEQEALSVDKYGSSDLNLIAPAVESFLSALVLDINVVNAILKDQLDTGASDWHVATWPMENHWRLLAQKARSSFACRPVVGSVPMKTPGVPGCRIQRHVLRSSVSTMRTAALDAPCRVLILAFTRTPGPSWTTEGIPRVSAASHAHQGLSR